MLASACFIRVYMPVGLVLKPRIRHGWRLDRLARVRARHDQHEPEIGNLVTLLLDVGMHGRDVEVVGFLLVQGQPCEQVGRVVELLGDLLELFVLVLELVLEIQNSEILV